MDVRQDMGILILCIILRQCRAPVQISGLLDMGNIPNPDEERGTKMNLNSQRQSPIGPQDRGTKLHSISAVNWFGLLRIVSRKCSFVCRVMLLWLSFWASANSAGMAETTIQSSTQPCLGILRDLETHTNRWQWTRDSVNEMKGRLWAIDPFSFLYMGPLIVLAVPADILVMPFRHRRISVLGEINGFIMNSDGRPLADFPWKSWPSGPFEYEYPYPVGKSALKAWTLSYHRRCTDANPCRPKEADEDESLFGTNNVGEFKFTFSGYFDWNDYFELHFGPPVNDMILIVRENDGKIVAKNASTHKDICSLQLPIAADGVGEIVPVPGSRNDTLGR